MGTQSLKHRIQIFYDHYHSQRLRAPHQEQLQRIWSLFSGRVLEVGAGRWLWQNPSPHDYVVVDFSHIAMERAMEDGALAVLADGEFLPFDDGEFDTVACHDVLEHVVDPQRFLHEMCRVSRAKVICGGPNYVGMRYAPGLDRYLACTLLEFLRDRGGQWHRLDDAYLSFDEGWHPDRDAVSAVNARWVERELRRHGCTIRGVGTWSDRYSWLDRMPLIRYLGPFMLVIGDKRVG